MWLWELYITYEHYIVPSLLSLGIFLIFLLLRRVFTKYVFALLVKLSRKAPSELLTQLFLAYEKPFQWFFIIIGIYVSIGYFPYLDQSSELFTQLIRSGMIVLISWGLFNFTASTSLLFTRLKDRFHLEIDEVLIPFLSKVLRFIIVALSISVIAQEFGYAVGGFVAGLGLGGLAISLAAKDALANLFGGVVIITEKPFKIGDWILTPSIEGVVEEITFRSTKIRTFAHALATIPNATLANEPITNWSEMGKRRVYFHLQVTYDASKEQLENVVRRIEHLLKNHPDIHQETLFVTLDEYKENGFDILLYYFTKTTVWGEYLKIKEEINFKILDILRSENVAVAIPARRLYQDSDPNEPNDNSFQ